jgi:hypothetical protein
MGAKSMRIFSDNEHLDIERWQELEHTNPHYLAKLLEQRSAEVMPEVYKESLNKGVPVSYGDPEFGNALIEEHPDGRRFIINVTYNESEKKFNKEYIREVPKRIQK